jgi:hypothetical protein
MTEELKANIHMCVKDYQDGMKKPPNLDQLREYAQNASYDDLLQAMEYFLEAEKEYVKHPAEKSRGVKEMEMSINLEIESRWQHKYYSMIATWKGTIRYLRHKLLPFGVTYHKYTEVDDEEEGVEVYGIAGGYIGWYESRGKPIAFMTNKGIVQYRW